MGGDQESDEQDPAQQATTNEPEYLDRSKLDFDPDDGLYTGTAVEGTSDIPGPHEKGDDTEQQQDDADQ